MNKKLIAPVVVAILLIVYFAVYGAVLLFIPDAPIVLKIIGAMIPVIGGGYTLWAAKERIDEIKGGEEDDLSQY